MEQKTKFLFRKTSRMCFGKERREENYKVRKWTVKETRYWIHKALGGQCFRSNRLVNALARSHTPAVNLIALCFCQWFGDQLSNFTSKLLPSLKYD